MARLDLDRAKQLAAMSPKDVGKSEEAVKINFAVPLLEALGHSRVLFEHRRKDMVLRARTRPRTTVVVEAKRAGEPLDRHLAQLERYAYEERSLLAVITNGAEVRLYVPLWANAPSFADTLLLAVRREELGDAAAFRRLARVLGADALSGGAAARHIATWQAKRERAWKHLAAVQGEAARQRDRLEARLRELEGQAGRLEAEKGRVQGELARTQAALERSLEVLRGCYGVRGAPAGPPPAGPPPRRKAPKRREPTWSEDELFRLGRENQRLILGAFAQAGTRTLGLKEIARATGLSPQATQGSLSRFTAPVRFGTKEPFFEVQRTSGKERKERGVLFTIVEKYWKTVLKLYR